MLAMTGVHAVGHTNSHSSGGSHNHVDIGFCTDMTVHHVQALDMCERVIGQDTGGPVQAAATEVLRNQSIEVGMMRAWLADWGASTVTPETVMSWMDMDHEHMTADGIPLADMPGYATPEQLTALIVADGRHKGRLWLELMRAHHVGGVAMAESAMRLASEKKVVRLATNQIAAQTYEISVYDTLLSTSYL